MSTGQPDAEPAESGAAMHHWADVAADRTLRAHPGASEVTVAAGITPSGVVHVGNFREVITVDLVARALRDRGVAVRFLYSWDDFDVLRKVPTGAPQPEMLHEHLRESIADVPDPWGDHDSYASHHIAAFETSLAPLGIAPQFVRQSGRYRSGAYAEGIRTALAATDTIRAILDEARRQHGDAKALAPDWLPIAGFCDACNKDAIATTWDGQWGVHVRCTRCGHESDVDLRVGGNLKLPWRVDWPMRWAHERVRFEPGGKDHSTAGGSYDTAKSIARQVYGWQPPEYVGYDFVSPKGLGGKFSSSKGNVVTVADCLDVYEPEVLRFLFASYRPNTEFSISFDLDVLKLYEDYDRAFKLAHEADDGSRKDGKRRVARRTIQLADVAHRPVVPGSEPPRLPALRHLSVIVQIFDGDVAATRAFYQREGQIAGDEECRRFDRRARCAWAWVQQHAPDEFRYAIRREPVTRSLAPAEREALTRLVDVLAAHPDADDATLGGHMRELVGALAVETKAFYAVVYDLLLGRDRGPKLSTLLAAIGGARAVPLLRASLVA